MKTEHSVLKVILRTVKQNKGMCVTLFAAVLGSAVKAISMARYRLRKSLNLHPQEDIFCYLRNI